MILFLMLKMIVIKDELANLKIGCTQNSDRCMQIHLAVCKLVGVYALY